MAGPSGSGKTTLLYLLAGILQPDSGRLFIDGQPLARLRPGRDLAGLVGIIHQQYDLVPHLTVLHNVLAGRLGQWGLLRSVVSLAWPQDRRLAEARPGAVGDCGQGPGTDLPPFRRGTAANGHCPPDGAVAQGGAGR